MGRIAIIGAGQAGAQAVITLRQKGYSGELTLIGAESEPPYQRPPLSKSYLKGELDRERLYFKPASFYKENEITLRRGERVTVIDRASHLVELDSGTSVEYDKLLIATGAPARSLPVPGADLAGAYSLRSMADSDAMKSLLSESGRLVVIGAGYIGLEVAAVMKKAGRPVTVIDVADTVLGRVGTPPISSFLKDLHESEGVEFKLGLGVDEIVGKSRVEAVKTSDGAQIDCSSVVIGIGAVPEIELAVQAGLPTENGIVVDEFCRTEDECIFAAGDCANFPSARYARRLRLESVPNAIEQGKAAGLNLMGIQTKYDPLPWFWSDQYDTKLQTVGLASGHGEYIIRGDVSTGKFSVWYFQDGGLLAVDAISDGGAFAASKMALTTGKSIDRTRLADLDVPLKELLI